MGLDSVELLMGFENYFGIQIPDLEAEKIITVQDMVDSVANHLKITSTDSSLKTNLLAKINNSLENIGLITTPLSNANSIFQILLPYHDDTWKKLSDQLGLKLPKPELEPKIFGSKFLHLITGGPRYNWQNITTEQFIQAICAENYEKLINPNEIKNTFEILLVIAAITVEKTGIDPYEVEPGKTFTRDFGID